MFGLQLPRQKIETFRRLKVLSSSQQQNKNFIRFKCEAREAENKSPSSSRLFSVTGPATVASRRVVSLRDVRSTFIHFFFFLGGCSTADSAETRPNTDSQTVKLSGCPALDNKSLRSEAQEEGRSATLRGLMSWRWPRVAMCGANWYLMETMTEGSFSSYNTSN